MKMKKLAAVALAVVMSVSMLAGCGSSNDKKSAESSTSANGTATVKTAKDGVSAPGTPSFCLLQILTPDSIYFSSATGSGRSMPPQWLQSRQSRTDSQRLFQVPPSASASGSLHSSHRSRSHPRPGT